MSKDDLSLDKAYKQLELIVSEFEQGKVKLEEAAGKFAQATKLAKFIKKHLEQIENEVEEVRASFEIE